MTEQTTALSIIDVYAERRMLTRDDLVVTMMKTIMPRDKSGNDLATKADLLGFLQVAHSYDLDPWAREIYCIVSRGKVLPYISIDGYAKIVNRQPEYDGCEFDYQQNADGQFEAVTCTMWRKDRSRPVRITEFMAECYKPDSDAWKRNPARMLRHRAFIQAARLSFPIAAGLDEDSAEHMIDITPAPPSAPETEQRAPRAPRKAAGEKAPPPAQDPQKAPPADERQGFRSFDDGPTQPATEPAGGDKKSGVERTQQEQTQTKAAPKAPPAASNSNAGAQQREPETQHTATPAQQASGISTGNGRPDVEEVVNELNDRLGEARNPDQLLQIWTDINPASALSVFDKPEMERWLSYLQKQFDRLNKKLQAAADKGK